ncbi:MAG: META domain-containing protein [Pseudomonadota bacterium]
MLKPTVLALVFALPNCWGDETISGYADSSATYALTDIDGAPFGAHATIRFPEEGRIEGEGPCNSFSGAQSAPYPWFDTGSIAATRRACPDLPAETAFFTALSAMTLSEAQGDILILSNEEGREMIFRRMSDG